MIKRLAILAALVLQFSGSDNGNVGDGKEYEFIVSNVSGEEIHGIPVNGATDDIKGILLYDDEIDFMADEGDRIGVTWGEEEDIFSKIRLIREGGK